MTLNMSSKIILCGYPFKPSDIKKRAIVTVSVKASRATNVRFSKIGRKIIQKAIVAIESADEVFFSCLNEKQLETYKSLTSIVISGNGL